MDEPNRPAIPRRAFEIGLVQQGQPAAEVRSRPWKLIAAVGVVVVVFGVLIYQLAAAWSRAAKDAAGLQQALDRYIEAEQEVWMEKLAAETEASSANPKGQVEVLKQRLQALQSKVEEAQEQHQANQSRLEQQLEEAQDKARQSKYATESCYIKLAGLQEKKQSLEKQLKDKLAEENIIILSPKYNATSIHGSFKTTKGYTGKGYEGYDLTNLKVKYHNKEWIEKTEFDQLPLRRDGRRSAAHPAILFWKPMMESNLHMNTYEGGQIRLFFLGPYDNEGGGEFDVKAITPSEQPPTATVDLEDRKNWPPVRHDL